MIFGTLCVLFATLHMTVGNLPIIPLDEREMLRALQQRFQGPPLPMTPEREQIQNQLQQIMEQQKLIRQRLREQRLQRRLASRNAKQFMLPAGEEDADDLNESIEYVGLTSQPAETMKKSKKMIIPRDDYKPPANVMSSSLKKQGVASADWGEFSCCRQSIGLQTRERVSTSRYIQIQTRECSWNYCEECVDDLPTCQVLRDFQGACSDRSSYKGFMSRHCPQTCGWCETKTKVVTTTVPSTRAPPVPTPNRNMRQIYVQFYVISPSQPYLYKFSTSKALTQSWRLTSQSSRPGEVRSFYLYARPTSKFNLAIYFCKAKYRNTEKFMINKNPCPGRWVQYMKLYAAESAQPNTQLLFVGGRGRGPWTSRVFKGTPCCGYERPVWNFFAPNPSTRQPAETTKRPVVSATRPTVRPTGRALPVGPTPRPVKPFLPTTTRRPVQGGPTSEFHRECLTYHNFYRAIHGVPALQWDPSLVKTSKKWADFLVDAAPNHPYDVKPGVQRTPSWPHSSRGTKYRGRGVGENIAWDFSIDGSPAKESVLRWYAEIFDYKANNPTYSAPGKPVGHYTQMLWKDSSHLGCSVAVKTINRHGWEYQTTYTVAHYAPSGNIHYPTQIQTKQIYNRNVPRRKQGTCLSSSTCSVYNNEQNRCMGFGNTMRCGCSRDDKAGVFGGRPRCTGSGGCLVACKRPPTLGAVIWSGECQGERSCECIYAPRGSDRRIGAICT